MIAVIKYNSGNTKSLGFALQRLGVDYMLTNNPEEIKSASKVIFPGVGEASSTMRYLIDNQMDIIIKQLTQPVLGICLGMQLLCKHSQENNTPCLGIFDERVEKIPATNGLKVPHMGWNEIKEASPWLGPLPPAAYAYFVHSYYVPKCPTTSAICEYGVAISAAIQKDNFYGLQFHPEKSGDTGDIILKSFLQLP